MTWEAWRKEGRAKRGCALFLGMAMVAGFSTIPAYAQDAAAAVPADGPDIFSVPIVSTGQQVGDMGLYLSRMNYDPGRNGALLVVDPNPQSPLERPLPNLYKTNQPAPALGTIALAFARRLVNVGRLTILPPREMTLINTQPGKASIMSGLQGSEAMQWLLTTFTSDQWARACGDGISLSDLSPEQRPFFEVVLPKSLKIQKMTYEKTAEGGFSVHAEGEPVTVDMRRMRFRLNRSVSFTVPAADNENSYYGFGDYDNPEDGQTRWQRVWNGEDGNREPDRTSLYGVPIIIKTPNRLKPGDLDYAAPQLDAGVPLTGSEKTIGDVLKAVSATTGIEILTDRRAGALPVFLCIVPNQGIRAGDILEGLARSVTGTYRRLSPTSFLLTYDIEGIGTKWMKVSNWAGEANMERSRLMEKAMEQASKRVSVSDLRNDPDDSRALPDDMMQKILKKWTDGNPYEGYDAETAKLPDSMKKQVEKGVKMWEQMTPPIRVRTDKVRLNVTLKGTWITGDGIPLRDLYEASIDSYMLVRMFQAGRRPTPSPEKDDVVKKEKARYIDPKIKRRILAVAPATVQEAEQCIMQAKLKGFNELFLSCPLNKVDDAGLAPLKAAITAGKKNGIAVFAMTPLLQKIGVGEADINLLGETAEQAYTRTIARDKRMVPSTPGLNALELLEWISILREEEKGWITPTDAVIAEVTRRILTVARTPGLAGVILQSVSAPGYYRQTDERFGIQIAEGGGFGFGEEHRLDFLRAQGIDPVDIPVQNYSTGNLDTNLPYFSAEIFQAKYRQIGNEFKMDPAYQTPNIAWSEFLDKRSMDLLAKVYQAIRKERPNLPLYQDDRQGTQWGTKYFASFDAAESDIRVRPYGNPKEIAESLRGAAKIILYRHRINPKPFPGSKIPDFPRSVAGDIGEISKQYAPNWDGMVVDLTLIPVRDALPLITPLEPSPKQGASAE